MILGIYATLGVFLMIASRNPSAHRSLIWFMVWSSAVHGGIMAVQSLAHAHIWDTSEATYLLYLRRRSSLRFLRHEVKR